MTRSHITESVHQLQAHIDMQSSRLNKRIEIIAVSKTYPISYVSEALSIGISVFGENRVQEAEEKFYSPSVSNNTPTECTSEAQMYIRNNITLHLIGSLQSNKAKKALEYFDCIQSIDRISLIEACHKVIKRDALARKDIFLQITCSDYDHKQGFSDYAQLKNAVEYILKEGLLHIKGLMTIAPFVDDECIVRKAFATARYWKEQLEKDFAMNELKLSMGMSNDYMWAIEEGSDVIRIGSAIFGARI